MFLEMRYLPAEYCDRYFYYAAGGRQPLANDDDGAAGICRRRLTSADASAGIGLFSPARYADFM